MGLFFGTDGIRGRVDSELTANVAYKVGKAVGVVCGKGRILVGRDTRISGSSLTLAFALGVTGVGVDVDDVGVIPTAGVAYLTRSLGYNYGVVISASHNGGEYNGIKVFGGEGYKLSEKEEEQIERRLLYDNGISGKAYGKYRQVQSFSIRYADFLTKSCKTLSGLSVVLDCANGASGRIAPRVFRALGAKVTVINNGMSGEKINENCGSLHVESLIKKVVTLGADVGFAFDGDADRVIAVDGMGRVLDGDMIMYVLARHLKGKGELLRSLVVGTELTNTAIENALLREGIGLVRANVGDRCVMEQMVQNGLVLGGEQSGHIILKSLSTTGDGILTAIVMASILVETGKRASEMFDVKLYPQENVSVTVKDKLRVINSDELGLTVARLKNALVGRGRLTVRASGTEPKIRIMVESEDDETNKSYAEAVEKLIVKIDSEE